jgi:hypothetical protein
MAPVADHHLQQAQQQLQQAAEHLARAKRIILRDHEDDSYLHELTDRAEQQTGRALYDLGIAREFAAAAERTYPGRQKPLTGFRRQAMMST